MAQPITPLEKTFAIMAEQPGGLAMWGALLGSRCSSTRAELAAGILAAAAPLPCHQATDSMAYGSKTN